jgi:dinuclear metal center YbgI/SA1388 family protein
MKFNDLVNFLDNAFPKRLSAESDNDGVEVCTDRNLEIGRILLTLDITFDIIEYAATHGYNCVIAHHPMIFSPLKKLDFISSASRKAALLARRDICAVSLHTRLDAVSGGVNDCLLDIIGVNPKEAEIFGAEGIENAGRIFSYSPGISAKDFAAHIKKSLENFYKSSFAADIPVAVKYIEGDKPVQKVGSVSGSGMDFAVDAVKLGVDTYLTGEGSYHKAMDAYEFNVKGERVNIIMAGHFETETLVLPYLKNIIAGGFPQSYIDIYATPLYNFL